jgi:hypothetical protein
MASSHEAQHLVTRSKHTDLDVSRSLEAIVLVRCRTPSTLDHPPGMLARDDGIQSSEWSL